MDIQVLMISLEKTTCLGKLLKTGLESRMFIRRMNQLNIDSERDERMFIILMISGKQILLI